MQPETPETPGVEKNLVLFLSADIVGSTAYKNRRADRQGEHPWLELFREFFENFPTTLNSHLEKEEMKEFPTLWKSMGDELIFFSICQSPSGIVNSIAGFRKAIGFYSDKKMKKQNLGIKGTAWLAGYPVINAKISGSGKVGVPDFIGPSMDTGFRLAKFSSERKLGISLELAYIIADSGTSPSNIAAPEFQVFFDHPKEMKGVLGGKPYPRFWVNVHPPNYTPFEEKLLGEEKKKADFDHIKKYCEEFVESVGDDTVLCLPYIHPNGPHEEYRKPPDSHLKIIRELENKAKASYARSASELGPESETPVPTVEQIKTIQNLK